MSSSADNDSDNSNTFEMGNNRDSSTDGDVRTANDSDNSNTFKTGNNRDSSPDGDVRTANRPDSPSKARKYLVWRTDETELITGPLTTSLRQYSDSVEMINDRLEDLAFVQMKIDQFGPTHVFVVAEDATEYTIAPERETEIKILKTNVIGVYHLAKLCAEKNIHCTVFTNGNIYQQDAEHYRAFKETDKPNLKSLVFESEIKLRAQEMLKDCGNCLILRICQPVTEANLAHGFISMIMSNEYKAPFYSCTVLHDLLPVAIRLANNKQRGVFNLVNPGVITAQQVKRLFVEQISLYAFDDADIGTLDEGKTYLGNCELDTGKLETRLQIHNDGRVKDVVESIRDVFERMRLAQPQPMDT